jgi:hypothetical protein
VLNLASGASRRYEIRSVADVPVQDTTVLSQRSIGLTVMACGTVGNTRVVLAGLYLPDAVVPPVHEERSRVADWFEVAIIEVTQTDQLRVTVDVTNRSGALLDLNTLTDQLSVDGVVVPPVDTATRPILANDATERVTFQYRVPSISPPSRLVWQYIAPDGQRADVRVTIPTP